MNYETLYKELQQGHYHPVYLLHGEEPYFIDKISDYIQDHALSNEEKEFNLYTLYGFETTPTQVIDICKTYPMLGEKQVVLLKEAQKMKGDGNKNNGVEKLESYLKAPLPSTILVISYKFGKIDGRSKFWKNVASKLPGFESKALYDNELPQHVRQIIKNKGLKEGDKKVVDTLIEYLGNDLNRIEKSLDKLHLNLKSGSVVIQSSDIEKYIGISAEYSVFELQKALANSDKTKAYTLAQYYMQHAKDHHPILVVNSLYGFFSKAYLYLTYSDTKEAEASMALNYYQKKDFSVLAQHYTLSAIEKIIHLLSKYDLKLKGVDYSGEKEPLLYDLIFQIFALQKK